MPKDPGYIDKWNYITTFWANPCHAPFSAYVELAKEPAKNAAIAWVIPSLTDVGYNYIRPGKAMGPRGGGGGRRGKGRGGKGGKGAGRLGKAWRKTPGLGNDTGGWIGNRLPGADDLNKRAISDGEKLFFTFGDFAQKILFGLFLLDTLTDFFYDWAILMDESEFCQSQFRGGFHYEGPSFNYGGVLPCNAVYAPTELWREGDCGWFGNRGFVGARPWQVIIALDCENTGLFPANFFIQWTLDDLQGHKVNTTKVYTVLPGTSFGAIASFSVAGPGTFSAIACATPGTLITAHRVDAVAYGGGPAPK